jgi:hypothetical protein
LSQRTATMKKSANIAPNLHLKRARERQGWCKLMEF